LTDSIQNFEGFTNQTFKFFKTLEKNNNVEWFNKNRGIYESQLVTPSKAFVTSIGPFFNQLNPLIRTEPKFNSTLMRINKDMRFAKGSPYKNYFLIHFGKFKMDSEFYVYLDKTGLSYGLFINNTAGDNFHFPANIHKYKNNIEDVFLRYNIEGRFNLHTFDKEPTILRKNFKFGKDPDLLAKTKFILLEKYFSLEKKIIYTPTFLNEMIKTFSKLYPLYCFAVSPEPLKLIEDFEENLGVAQ
jgi:uncharacterized protein (TIGR02453 family)